MSSYVTWARLHARPLVLFTVWALLARIVQTSGRDSWLEVLTIPTAILAVTAAVAALVWAVRVRRERVAAGFESAPLWRVAVDVAHDEVRRQRLVSGWANACVGQKLTATGGSTPRLLGLRAVPGGDFRATITSTSGVPVSDVMTRTSKLAEVIGCLRIKITPAKNGTTAQVDFRWRNHLGKPVLPQDLPAAPPGHIVVGRRDDGSALTIRVLNAAGESVFVPTLIGAFTGGGKSGALWAILAGLNRAGIPTRLYVHDGAGGVELAMLEDALLEGSQNPDFTIAGYEPGAKGFAALIKDVNVDRAERLARMRVSKLRAWKPTREDPLTLVIVDELSQVPKAQRQQDTELHTFMVIGRKSAHSVIVLTQLGEKENVGPLREGFPRRIALATKTVQQTVAILAGEIATAPPAHLIPEDQQGTAFMDAGGRQAAEFRFAYYDDAAIERLARGLLPRGVLMDRDRTEAGQAAASRRSFSLRSLLPGRRRAPVGEVPVDDGAVEQLQAELGQEPEVVEVLDEQPELVDEPGVAAAIAAEPELELALERAAAAEPEPEVEPEPTVPQHALLRLYSYSHEGARLEYVEATADPITRYESLSRRYRRSPGAMRWWADVQRFRQMEGQQDAWRVITWHDTEAEALRAEAAAIAAEQPRQTPLRRKLRAA